MIESKNNQLRPNTKAVFKLLSSALTSTLLLLSFLLSTSLNAQTIPSLQSPSSLTGAASSAQFAAGARVGNGAFTNSFQYSDTIELQMEVSPEAGHVGNAGNIYALIIVGGQAYTLNTSNEWVVFDGTIEGLGGALILP